MTTYTTADLVQAANARWAQVAETIGAQHSESSQISDLIRQANRVNEAAEHALCDAETDQARLPHWHAEQITYAFRSALQTAFYAAQNNASQGLRLLAMVALHTDYRHVASLAQADGSLLVAHIGDDGGGIDTTGDIVRLLGGDIVHGPAQLSTEHWGLDSYVALWRIPAETSGEWESWRERVYGPRADVDRRPIEERNAALAEVRALATARV